MIILAIETSCDETGVSLVEARGDISKPQFNVLSDITHSQIKLHQQYGGVFPHLAKREHAKNLIPIFKTVLEESKFLKPKSTPHKLPEGLETLLAREPELLEQFVEFIPTIEKPAIDHIAVTYGPGLEPALWVGINFAKALSEIWQIPVIPINHMEGHLASVLINPKPSILHPILSFPALALLISGGHTELVVIKEWGDYSVVGKTKDDAVGECFDKVARMLDLPYPGGPEISRLAEIERKKDTSKEKIKFPRPMINTPDLNFSFSGLKTSVLYYLRENPIKTESQKQEIAKALEDAIGEVLITKTEKAVEEYDIKSLIIAGGVSANKFLRESFTKKFGEKLTIFIPSTYLSTDNALMIAAAGYLKYLSGNKISHLVKAEGNLSL